MLGITYKVRKYYSIASLWLIFAGDSSKAELIKVKNNSKKMALINSYYCEVPAQLQLQPLKYYGLIFLGLDWGLSHHILTCIPMIDISLLKVITFWSFAFFRSAFGINFMVTMKGSHI